MSLPTIPIAHSPTRSTSTSSGHRSTTPSPTLSHKSISGRSPLSTTVTTATSSLSSPLSPVIEAMTMSPVPPLSMLIQHQQPKSKHVRSNSSPSLPQVIGTRAPIEYTASSVSVLNRDHSSSAANLLSFARDNILNSYGYTFSPKSPRLMPLRSPGPVTPMQLEEDIEYRFPVVTTPVRHSPLVMPLTLKSEEEDNENDQVVEMPLRSR
jgi:hypothetical protein